MPDHWHLTCRKTLADDREFVLRFVVRDKYEDAEAAAMRESGYSVKFESCNDHAHLGAAMRPKSEGGGGPGGKPG